MGEYADVDKWIETLRQCKPLSEANVKGLCDKVGPTGPMALLLLYSLLTSFRLGTPGARNFAR
jgi:hypothetical protein